MLQVYSFSANKIMLSCYIVVVCTQWPISSSIATAQPL